MKKRFGFVDEVLLGANPDKKYPDGLNEKKWDLFSPENETLAHCWCFQKKEKTTQNGATTFACVYFLKQTTATFLFGKILDRI